jgi:VIT1/CCC1 family predicted Fe2+/Mn2+ transporter
MSEHATVPMPGQPNHGGEAHSGNDTAKLNWLRAGVLGANDGIVATAGLVIGVAASGAAQSAVLTAGLAGLAAGALSMAAGEYVSVSTQRDTEAALISKERRELAEQPEAELAELAGIYAAKGLAPELAEEVARQLTSRDALAAHAEVELKLDPDDLTSPWQAAGASALSFVVGSVIPLATILLVHGALGMWLTVLAAAVTLAVTGYVSARLGGAPVGPAVARNVGGGMVAMAVTYAIGAAVGARLE